MTQDEKYMKEAMKQAKKAAAIEEVPIGEGFATASSRRPLLITPSIMP